MRKNSGVLTGRLFGLIVLTDLLQVASEVLFKKGSSAVGIDALTMHNIFIFTGQVLTRGYIWLGILLFLLNFLMWIIVLSKLDLSVAYPIGSTPYIIIPIVSLIFLHEKISWERWCGIALIIVGMCLISQSTHTPPDQS